MKLPPLPAMDYHSNINASYGYSAAQASTIQAEAARAALEEAAKIAQNVGWEIQQSYNKALPSGHGCPFIHNDIREAIRAVVIEGEV